MDDQESIRLQRKDICRALAGIKREYLNQSKKFENNNLLLDITSNPDIAKSDSTNRSSVSQIISSEGRNMTRLCNINAQTKQLGTNMIKIGRNIANNIVITDSSISRFHANLHLNDQIISIERLGSGPICQLITEERQLFKGDIFLFGMWTLQIEEIKIRQDSLELFVQYAEELIVDDEQTQLTENLIYQFKISNSTSYVVGKNTIIGKLNFTDEDGKLEAEQFRIYNQGDSIYLENLQKNLSLWEWFQSGDQQILRNCDIFMIGIDKSYMILNQKKAQKSEELSLRNFCTFCFSSKRNKNPKNATVSEICFDCNNFIKERVSYFGSQPEELLSLKVYLSQ